MSDKFKVEILTTDKLPDVIVEFKKKLYSDLLKELKLVIG